MKNASKATMNLERITRTVRACYIDLEEENKKLKERIEELSGNVLHEMAKNKKLVAISEKLNTRVQLEVMRNHDLNNIIHNLKIETRLLRERIQELKSELSREQE